MPAEEPTPPPCDCSGPECPEECPELPEEPSGDFSGDEPPASPKCETPDCEPTQCECDDDQCPIECPGMFHRPPPNKKLITGELENQIGTD